MPGSVPLFRVFISSTFADLEDERAALHRRVFPEIRRLCAAQGAQFQAIDLRWGVSTEASRDQRAVAICLEEIDRCLAASARPNFVLLLGNRYGWCPAPETVTADDFGRLCAGMTPDDVKLVKEWYLLDANSVPPHYRLQPRHGAVADDDAWRDVEDRLRAALRRAVETQVAAGGQEHAGVAALSVEASVTDLEVERALSRSDLLPGAAHAFLRTIAGLPTDQSAGVFADGSNGDQEGSPEAVQRLRARVRDRLGADYVHEYSAWWNATSARPTRDHLDALCADVQAALESTIREELGLRKHTPNWQQEDLDHQAFGRERSAAFAGRQAILGELVNRSSGPFTAPVLLLGAAGSGKTAVLAELARSLPVQSRRQVIARFIGATPRSVQVRSLVQDFTSMLRQHRGAGTQDRALGTDAAVDAFRAELGEPRPADGTVLIVDGLDQLAGDPVDLAWLPTVATPGVQVVLSAQSGSVADAVVRHLETTPLALGPMPREDGEQLLDSWLRAAGRHLQPDQRAEVLRAFGQLGLPLHLRLAFEDARRWASSTLIPRGFLAEDVDGLIGQLLDRLEREHGTRLVAAALGYLAASRNGLNEDEALDLLSANTDVGKEVSEQFPRSPAIEGRVPPVLWARLYSDLRPYLVQRPSDGRVLLGFFHRQLADGIKSRYLSPEIAQVRHRELAKYFESQPFQLFGADEAAPNLRKLSELPYQQTRGALWTELYMTLTDFRFLEAKVRWSDVEPGTDETGVSVTTHHGVYALEEDLKHSLDCWPSSTMAAGDNRQEALSALLRAVRRESDVLADHPDMTWQQLAYRLQWTPGPAADLVVTETARRAGGRPWLRLRIPFNESSALVRRLNPPSEYLSSCAMTPTGSLAVSTGVDGTVAVWNPASGRKLRMLRGAGQPVTCAVTPDGRFALAAGGDGTLRVWQISDGQKVANVAAAHQGSVNACAALPDGGAAFTFGADGAVRSWRLPDLHPSNPLAVDAGHLTFGALSMDGTTIAYGNRESSQVVLRSVQRGGHEPVLLDAGSAVMSCAFGSTPTFLLTGHVDGTLSTWTLPAGRDQEVQAHNGEVFDCAVTADGSLAATAGADDEVKLWRLPDLALVATLRGHQGSVISCRFSGDGNLLISAGDDGTACLWDTGLARAAQHDGHTQLVESCAFTPDGDTLLTASTDGTLRQWSVSNGSQQGAALNHSGSTVLMATSGERILLAAGQDGAVLLVPRSGRSPVQLGMHGALVWTLVVPPDGSVAVTGGDDGKCRVWDLDKGGERLVFPGDGSIVRSCAVNRAGTRVVSAGDAGIVHSWDALSGSAELLTGHTAPVWSVSMSPRGWVAAGAKDGSVRIWCDPTGRDGELLGRHGNSVEHLLWVDPENLVSAAVDGSIALWSASKREALLRWSAHRGPVRGIASAPAGKLLVSAGADGILAIWSLTDGALLASVPFSGQLRSVAAHPTEHLVAVTGDGGLVHIAELADWPTPW